MGKVPQGILGAVSGTVGKVVRASWKGIAYIRSKAASVANPRTEGQVRKRRLGEGEIQLQLVQLRNSGAFPDHTFKWLLRMLAAVGVGWVLGVSSS